MTPERWRQLGDLFNQAIEAAPEERPALLERGCGGDGELRLAVERMLAADGATGGSFEGALDRAAAGVAGDPPAARRIGPYDIIRELGRGGMGVVYLAVRADDEYRKQVAVKVLQWGLESATAVERFRRERQILAGLEHPNIARLLDGGSTAQGLPYIVMDLVDGKPLLAYAAERTLSPARRLELFLAIAGAVEHAHQQLVVHRDLKPGNMLVDQGGTPKLLDFGVAKLLETQDHDRATQTQAFTPDYASPEQVRGEPATTATDVYALGAVLYELLSGERAQRVGPDLRHAFHVVCEQSPPLPSTVAPRGAARALRGDLDTIVMKALQKEPARRYGSVAELSADVRRHLAGEPVKARKDTTLYRASKFVRRNRVTVAAALLVLLALAGALVVSLRAARRAEHRYQEMRALAGGFLFEIHDQIARLPGATAARALVVARAQEYLEKLTVEETDDPDLLMDLAAAYLRLGDAQGGNFAPSLGRVDDALASYERARALLDRVPARVGGRRAAELRAEIDINGGDLLVFLSRFAEAEERLARGVRAAQVFRAAGLADRYLELRGWTALAFLAHLRGNRDDMLAAGRGAVAAAEALSPGGDHDADGRYWWCVAHELMADAQMAAGDVLASVAEERLATRALDEALALAPGDVQLLREEAKAHAILAGQLGDPYLINTLDGEAAQAAAERAVAMFAKLHADDPSDARGASELAFALAVAADIVSDARPEQALELYERALATAPAPAADHNAASDRATIMSRSSHALLRLGRVAESVTRARAGVAAKAAAIPRVGAEPVVGESLLEYAESLRLLADAELAAGHGDEAQRAVEEAVAVARTAWRAQARNPSALVAVVTAEAALGEVESARGSPGSRAALERSLALLDGWSAIAPEQPFVRARRAEIEASLARLGDGAR